MTTADQTYSMNLDPEKLTLGELIDFEEVTGTTIEDAFKSVTVRDEDGEIMRDPESGRPLQTVKLSHKAQAALVWLTTRRERPEFTFRDACNVPLAQLSGFGNDDDSEPEGNE